MRYKLKINKDIEEGVVNTYHKIEQTVVNAYKKVEDTFVDGYKDIESSFVERFLVDTDNEDPVENVEKKIDCSE